MHELALMASLVDAVRERVGETRVVSVRLEVGRLTAALPDALRFSFDVCAQGTSLEGATLQIAEIPARIRCGECGRESVVEDAIPLCAGCGGSRVEITGGRELRVTEVEVL